MENFAFSGLWKHGGSSILSGLLLIGDAVVSYLQVVQLPTWAHALVGIAALGLAFYKGKVQPKPAAA